MSHDICKFGFKLYYIFTDFLWFKVLDFYYLIKKQGIPENTDRSVVEMLLENCDTENQTTPKSIIKVDKNTFCIRYNSNKSG